MVLFFTTCELEYFHFWLYECWRSPLIMKVFEKKLDFVWLHRLFFFGVQPLTEAIVLLLQTREQKSQVKKHVFLHVLTSHCSFWDSWSKWPDFALCCWLNVITWLYVIAIPEVETYLKSFADFLLEPKKSYLFKSLRSDSICFCLLRQWVLNVPTSSCCSFSQSVNSESCWGGTCWLPLSSWSFSWSRRLSASLDFKKPWWTQEKLWGPIHHPTIYSIYLPINLLIHLQRVFAEKFPHLFCSLGSQSTHWRTAASPGTILQMTAFHL